ncbi:lysyl-tRNA synthetase class 2 [Methanocalculus alkaliphilus]|uniref:lysine--tRNA ligase n=1 Tax=Methanocalculus alkaliphilus TaxID=768730 RepID=UPI0020A03262|nr:lysine--tRNA ligase [Methanocalculus alkaliphilus]MCP1714541.1 lysyl-tRNA synthetase class 2 [Methanocalculus alkaliphilus]
MNETPGLNFDEQKVQKLRELQENGVAVYPWKYERTDIASQIHEKFVDIGHEKSEEAVSVAGRLYTKRSHGKTVFADLGDGSGKIQLYIRKNDLGDEAFTFFSKNIDIGDIVGVRGHIFRTKVGEVSIWVDEITLLSKAICPLPEKYHGLTKVETRYRQRYVDLITNDEARAIFHLRSRMTGRLRGYLNDRGYLEFETPTIQPIYGGANARPFTTYHNYLEQKLYLRIAPELYLKRLIVGGFEKVFEIAKNFRNEDIDTHHNPEFTMVEMYEAYADYHDMMRLTEDLISTIIRETTGSTEVTFEDQTISFETPWKRISMEDAVMEAAGIDIHAYSADELRTIAEEHAIDGREKATTPGEYLALFFEHFVEDTLIQPTFVYDFPIENSPLAKKHRAKPGFTERFELFVAGMELANGFSELNDPLDQKERFEDQDAKRQKGDLEAQMIDYDFINALGYGMPPTGGVGIGIDRLVMLATGQNSIKEVILFPSMKPLKQKEEEIEEA